MKSMLLMYFNTKLEDRAVYKQNSGDKKSSLVHIICDLYKRFYPEIYRSWSSQDQTRTLSSFIGKTFKTGVMKGHDYNIKQVREIKAGKPRIYYVRVNQV